MQSNFVLFVYNPLSQHSDRKFGEQTINCIAVYYPVLVGYLIGYPALSDSSQIAKMLSDVETCMEIFPQYIRSYPQKTPWVREQNVRDTHGKGNRHGGKLR